MINAEQARIAAEAFVIGHDLRGFSYRFAEVNSEERFPAEWEVVFDVVTPRGMLLDGPLVVIVDAETGLARFFM